MCEMRHELISSKTLRNCLDAEDHVMQTELTGGTSQRHPRILVDREMMGVEKLPELPELRGT